VALQVERDARSLRRRLISLISADWVPHYNVPSRGCLCLEPRIIRRCHLKLSRIPLIVSGVAFQLERIFRALNCPPAMSGAVDQ
jgi:hypothetical protein